MLSTLLDNSTTVLIFVATILLVWYVITLPSMRGLPPGPFPLSLFGNFLMLRMPGADFIGILKDLKEKYGKIFTLKIGSKPFIYINDLKLLQVDYQFIPAQKSNPEEGAYISIIHARLFFIVK